MAGAQAFTTALDSAPDRVKKHWTRPIIAGGGIEWRLATRRRRARPDHPAKQCRGESDRRREHSVHRGGGLLVLIGDQHDQKALVYVLANRATNSEPFWSPKAGHSARGNAGYRHHLAEDASEHRARSDLRQEGHLRLSQVTNVTRPGGLSRSTQGIMMHGSAGVNTRAVSRLRLEIADIVDSRPITRSMGYSVVVRKLARPRRTWPPRIDGGGHTAVHVLADHPQPFPARWPLIGWPERWEASQYPNLLNISAALLTGASMWLGYRRVGTW